ncbi:MAG: hypothetical protein GXO78_01880 [Calditrichaeota bacterium]|nr:hypothetical protein [Calditrichota bacterium]
MALPIYQKLDAATARFWGFAQTNWIELTRIRLRPSLYFGQSTRLSLEYEIDPLYSRHPLVIPLNTEKTTRQAWDLTWNPVQENRFSIIHYIDRLYLVQDFSFGRVTVGRQRIAWGTGRIWNPTDLFNPINPASFDKIEKDGADAVTFKWYLGNFTDLTLVYNYRGSDSPDNVALRFRTNFHTLDLSLMAGWFDRRIVVGGDFAGNLLEAGIRGEGILSISENGWNDSFVRYILGIDYQFTARLYALLEYQYNGEGKTNPLQYEWGRLYRGEILNLNRNYLFAQLMYQLHPLVYFIFSYNANLNDHSRFTLFLLSYSASDNSTLSLGFQQFNGDLLDEYGAFPESLFLKLEYYF